MWNVHTQTAINKTEQQYFKMYHNYLSPPPPSPLSSISVGKAVELVCFTGKTDKGSTDRSSTDKSLRHIGCCLVE